ncbi:MAB_1171c family putative transporter [Rhizomonospora bruguierae]|uniref:MAB_1171c family putative transporter n=1 Tax=Rhizomonospora bruguierae TaxID=1581705 RepID=UPI001BCAB416|nr:MAB_1171c family putative transporter [Micromonospora sp. NBRC 107566]
MTGPGAYVVLALLWGVAAYRTRVLLRPGRRPETWAIWGAVVALAAAATFFQPDNYHLLDTWLGVPNFAELAGHAMILVSAWQAQAILAFLIYPPPTARRKVVLRGALVLVTVALMAVFFTLAPVDLDVPQRFTSVYATAPWIVPYWTVFLIAVDVILIDMVRLVWRYARRTNREHLRFGLQLVAVGGIFGVLYWVQWLIYLVLRHAEIQPPAALHAVGTVCELSGIVFTVVGSGYPAIGRRLRIRTPGGWWADFQRYRQLYPLWHALTSATPEIVLSQPPRPVIDVRFWLNRRVIEIEDGLLQLGRRQAGADPLSIGAPPAADPVAWARAIRVALDDRTAVLPTGLPAERSSPAPEADDDHAARLAWQLRVGRAFARLPPATAAHPVGPLPG